MDERRDDGGGRCGGVYRAFRHGRRVQSASDWDAAWWHRGVSVWSVVLATMVLLPPVLGATIALGVVVGPDLAAQVSLVVAAAPFFVVYHVVLGLRAEADGHYVDVDYWEP